MITTRAPDGANKRIEEKKVKNWWIHCWSKQNYPQLANISFKIVLLKNNYRSSKFRDNLTKRTGILRSVQREWILEIQGVKSEEKNISMNTTLCHCIHFITLSYTSRYKIRIVDYFAPILCICKEFASQYSLRASIFTIGRRSSSILLFIYLFLTPTYKYKNLL